MIISPMIISAATPTTENISIGIVLNFSEGRSSIRHELGTESYF